MHALILLDFLAGCGGGLLGFGGLVDFGGAVMHFLTSFLFPVPLNG
jgi:hypothetical protein